MRIKRKHPDKIYIRDENPKSENSAERVSHRNYDSQRFMWF